MPSKIAQDRVYRRPYSNGTRRGLWDDHLTDVQTVSRILPHTNEAGDPFYIGDAYEESRIGQSGELIIENLLAYKARAP